MKGSIVRILRSGAHQISVGLIKVDMGCGLPEQTGKIITSHLYCLSGSCLWTWLLNMKHKSCQNWEVTQYYILSALPCFNNNIAKSTQLSHGFIKVSKISLMWDATKLWYILYFHKEDKVKFSTALTVSR